MTFQVFCKTGLLFSEGSHFMKISPSTRTLPLGILSCSVHCQTEGTTDQARMPCICPLPHCTRQILCSYVTGYSPVSGLLILPDSVVLQSIIEVPLIPCRKQGILITYHAHRSFIGIQTLKRPLNVRAICPNEPENMSNMASEGYEIIILL